MISVFNDSKMFLEKNQNILLLLLEPGTQKLFSVFFMQNKTSNNK